MRTPTTRSTVTNCPRPQRLIVVGERRVEGDGAGRRNDLIVDEGELAVAQGLSFLRQRAHIERRFVLGGANFVQFALRNGEGHVDRRDLGDGHQRRAGPGLHIVSGVDGHRAGYPRHGGVDVGVLEVELGRFDVGLIELDRAFVLLDHKGLVIGLLLGDRVFGLQLLVAREIGLGLGDQGLVVLELRLSLVERRLVGAGIDEKQGISRLDELPLLEKRLHDLTVHPTLHVHGLDRLHRPDRVDEDLHVALRDGPRDDRHGRLGRRNFGWLGPAQNREPHACRDDRRDQPQQNPATAFHPSPLLFRREPRSDTCRVGHPTPRATRRSDRAGNWEASPRTAVPISAETGCAQERQRVGEPAQFKERENAGWARSASAGSSLSAEPTAAAASSRGCRPA